MDDEEAEECLFLFSFLFQVELSVSGVLVLLKCFSSLVTCMKRIDFSTVRSDGAGCAKIS